MANKYYVLLETGRCDGPYSFKVAMAEATKWKEYGSYPEILKLVVSVDGRMVK